jgi:hypothetical protein
MSLFPSAGSLAVKFDAAHVERSSCASGGEPNLRQEDNHPTGKLLSIDDVDLPKGYFRSVYFWGSLIAIGTSVMSGVGGFSFIAPILSFIDADIGPSPDLTWVALTYTLTGAIGLMIVGRLSG